MQLHALLQTHHEFLEVGYFLGVPAEDVRACMVATSHDGLELGHADGGRQTIPHQCSVVAASPPGCRIGGKLILMAAWLENCYSSNLANHTAGMSFCIYDRCCTLQCRLPASSSVRSLSQGELAGVRAWA